MSEIIENWSSLEETAEYLEVTKSGQAMEV